MVEINGHGIGIFDKSKKQIVVIKTSRLKDINDDMTDVYTLRPQKFDVVNYFEISKIKYQYTPRNKLYVIKY